MHSLYRRHEQDCRFKKKGIRHIKCSCPVWMDGFDIHGKRQRRSLKTRSWSHAQARLQEIESGAAPLPVTPTSPQLDAAIAAYLDDCAARKLAPSTVVSYRNTLGHLEAFFPGKTVSAIDLDGLSRYRAARAVTSSSSTKEIGTIRAFFHFAAARKWTAESPARHLKLPKIDRIPTLPFADDEVTAILAACNRIDNQNRSEVHRAQLRARALMLTLLYSGFRISDAVKLERAAVDMKSGRLLVRMMKTRAPLYIRLPPIALEALAAVPVESPYFFWSGHGKLSSAVGSARRTVECVLRLAGIENGHPHRFRDTFSVSLLQNGTDLRTVQLLLGHTSIRTTEKHYAPFVTSMQQMLDDAVSTLHFGVSVPPRRNNKTAVNPKKNALGNPKHNLLAFPRSPAVKRA